MTGYYITVHLVDSTQVLKQFFHKYLRWDIISCPDTLHESWVILLVENRKINNISNLYTAVFKVQKIYIYIWIKITEKTVDKSQENHKFSNNW